jgi:hypothetical protein
MESFFAHPVDHREESIYDVGIELSAFASLQFLQGFFQPQTKTVGTIGDHGIKRVCHSDDPGAKANLIAG